STATFDWAVVGLGSLMLFGVHLDAWAHHRFALESFFTPWHGLLYSGFALLALLLAAAAVRGGGTRRGAAALGYARRIRTLAGRCGPVRPRWRG
ncbi:MAG: hypothetical protein AB1511_10910, partial [Deinococcota bacterium]